MTNKSEVVVQEEKSHFSGIDVGAEELILVIRKKGNSHHPQKFANTPADHARLVWSNSNEMLYKELSKVLRFTGKAVHS